MQIQASTVFIIAAMIMLAVLGHGAWHGGLIAVANFIVGVFTGGHVVG